MAKWRCWLWHDWVTVAIVWPPGDQPPPIITRRCRRCGASDERVMA